MSAYSKAFHERIESGAITAEEIMSGQAFIHEGRGSGIDFLTDEELLERLAIAVNTKLFYLLFFYNGGPMSGDFMRLITEIEIKYFDPKQKNPRINADISIVGFEGPITYILLKKTRITKAQMWKQLLQDYDEETKQSILDRIMAQDPKEDSYKDIMPLITGTENDKKMIAFVFNTLADIREKVIGKT